MMRRKIWRWFWLAWPAAGQWDDCGGDGPSVPAPPAAGEAMLELGRVQASGFVIDLGCGGGKK
jgi:hypothetical protein